MFTEPKPNPTYFSFYVYIHFQGTEYAIYLFIAAGFGLFYISDPLQVH
jgi:hypothetical protein